MRKFFFAFAIVILASSADAQFLWQVSHSDYDGRYDYSFDAISCFGNSCTVAGTVFDEKSGRIISLFWRSDDGGVSWGSQDPGLPYDTDFVDKKYFSAIQQIDSRNAAAARNSDLGDSVNTFVLHTFDSGKSWRKQYLYISDIAGVIRDISFSDSLSGMALTQKNLKIQNTIGIGFGDIKIFTTIDGGSHWDSSLMNFPGGKYKCHASGKGKYKLFQSPHGPIYSTNDNWITVDTSRVLINYSDDPNNYYYFNNCNFYCSDTVIAYGQYLYDTSASSEAKYRAVLIRSIDGGVSWEKPEIIAGSLWVLYNMTPLDRDTVLACGISINKILMSTDHGGTWREDSLTIQDTSYTESYSKGITFTGNGDPIAIYTYQFDNTSIPSIIIRGHSAKSQVEWSGKLSFTDPIFPNPAANILNIASVEAPKPFWIIDMMGRTVLSGMTLDHTTLTLDISVLSKGIYFVISEGNVSRMVIGKLAVIGK